MCLIETGHHEVNADGDPDLRAHGVLCGSEEGFDPQILFDPLEEEFDLPALLIDCRDGQSRQFEMIINPAFKYLTCRQAYICLYL